MEPSAGSLCIVIFHSHKAHPLRRERLQQPYARQGLALWRGSYGLFASDRTRGNMGICAPMLGVGVYGGNAALWIRPKALVLAVVMAIYGDWHGLNHPSVDGESDTPRKA